MTKTLLAFTLLACLSACALPETSIKTGAERPRFTFPNSTPDLMLVMDGVAIGPAARYDGNPGVLLVEEGTHLLEIKRNGDTVHREKAFVGPGETRAIDINTGSK